MPRVVGTIIRGNGEHSGEAQPYFGFLFGRQALPQYAVGECPRFRTPPGSKQRHGAPGHQLPTQKVPGRSQRQGRVRDVGRRAGVGHAERFGRIRERANRCDITGFGALRQLGGDLDRQRAAG
ncbi:MAG TPA: hypothetical protein VGJ95_04535 [Pseudonocardiaceae bacterium]